MIDHYNAFISYRHSDQDILVARRIQSDLEHFHIPAKIRKLTGKKKIDRIFLDKDELGAASNLSSDISDALSCAEHLIVICSTATKESRWVPREIEYFLRNHTRRQITTVLVDGEPEDVIPDILKYEERVLTDANGAEYTVRVPLEPLSCDYRLPRRKAKKEELPRLASKLLGCSYDELMNRRRAYMIRRLTIAFSLILAGAVGFGAYLIYSRTKIRENLESSLKNQSIYLANESLYSLNNEQRILALQLALEALPKDEDDSRPVTPQAIRALTESTLAYTTREGFGIEDIWNYRMPEIIWNGSCELSSYGNELAAWDKAGNVRVWNTSNHTVLFDRSVTTDLKKVTFLPGDKLMLITSKEVSVYRISDGSSLWTKSFSGTSFAGSDQPVFSDGSVLIATSDLKLHRLSSEDGSEIALYELPGEYDTLTSAISELQLSPDEDKVAVKIIMNFNDYHILVYNFAKSESAVIKSGEYISSYAWGDDANLIIASRKDLIGANETMDNVSHIKTDHVTLRCYDAEFAYEVWSYDFTATNVSARSDFLLLPANKAICYYYANKAEVFTVSEGECIASFNTNDPIVFAQDPDGDGWPFFVTEAGGLVFPTNTESVSVYPFFTGNLNQVFYNTDLGFFAHPFNDSEILHYGLYVCDDNWNSIKPSTEMADLTMAWMDDRIMALVSYESADKYPEISTIEDTIPILFLSNPATGEALQQIPLVDEKPILSTSIRFLGADETHFYLGYNGTKGYRVMEIDPGSGDYSYIDLAEDELLSTHDFCTLYNGRLYYCTGNASKDTLLCVYDLSTRKISEYKLAHDGKYIKVKDEPVILPIRNDVLLVTADELIIVDPDSGDIRYLNLPDDFFPSTISYDPSLDLIAESNNHDIHLLSLKDNSEVVINCPVTTMGISFFEDKKKDDSTILLVAGADGKLYRYNTETGALLGQSDITVSSLSNTNCEFKFDKDNGIMYLQMGDTLNIIETDSWYEETSIIKCLGHHAATDRFYVYSHPSRNKFTLGYFEHYSVDDLIEKAKNMLQDNVMPDEIKAEYGIEITDED